jgi:hypothetical protein
MTAMLPVFLPVTSITKSYDDILPEIMASPETNLLVTEIWPTLVDV